MALFRANLLVIQHLETLYLGGNHVRVVCKRVWRKVQECALSRALRLACGCKSTKEAHVWSMQESWRGTHVKHPQSLYFDSPNSSTLIISIVTSLRGTFSQILFSPYPYLWEGYLVLRKQLGMDQWILVDAMGYSGIQ